MDLASLLKSPPKVHNWGSGELTSTGLPTSVFEFMDKVLTPASRSVETGMGISTALFALKGGRHTCINPVQSEIDRLRAYAKKNDLSTDNITFLCKRSDETWFDLREKKWDFILVDGCHGFPIPFMDWYFFSQGLVIDGYVVIDDTHISTGNALKSFLLREDSWKLMEASTEKTAIFQKIKDFNFNKEWVDQPHTLEQTASRKKPVTLIGVARSIKRRLKLNR